MGKLLETLAAQTAGVKAGIAVGIVAVIAGAYFYWLYLPKSAELAKARKALVELEVKVAESRKTAAELPKFKAEVQELNARLIVALAQLPDAKDIPDLLAQVTRVAQDSGLEVLSFKPGAEARQGLYASIPVEMKASGTFHQLMVFFDRVSRLPRIVTVADIQLGNPKEANGRLGLAASFKTTTYRFIPDAPADAERDPKKGAKKGKKK
jgi:type IV pilus assembly protein PilO